MPCLVASAVLAMCAPAGQAGLVRVELRVDQTRTDRPISFVMPIDTFGVVSGLDTDAAQTLVSRSAAASLAELRDALEGDARPAVSVPVELRLPAAVERPGIEWDIILFGDRDSDGAWSAGEPYVTAWTGARGSYRLVYIIDPGSDQSAAVAGWNLVEGGLPRTYQPDLARTLVPLNPVLEPVDRS